MQDFIRDIPVAMFISSSTIHEKRTALALGAHDFISKLMNLPKMLTVLNEVYEKYLKKSAVHE